MQGTIAELKSRRASDGYILETLREQDARALMNKSSTLRLTEQNTLVFHGGENEYFSILQYIAENRIPIQRIERIEPTLESLFLEVTK